MLPKIMHQHIVRIVHEPHRVEYKRLSFETPDPEYAEYHFKSTYDAHNAVCVNIYQTYESDD